jgi:uncharacterized protein YjiK
MIKNTAIYLALITLSCCCNRHKSNAQAITSSSTIDFLYDLENPKAIVYLADEKLREISGLSPTDKPNIFLGIADEIGEAYFIDITGGTIVKSVLFREKGDFEGIEWVGKSIWAIKSDGDLFEISDFEKERPKVEAYKTQLMETEDLEGLGYDPNKKSLLLSCKNDLKSKSLFGHPVYSIDPLEVDRLLPNGPEDKANYFSPSAIAVHPKRAEVYILSSAKKRLVVLDAISGAIKSVHRINKKMIPQPEGIAFDANGVMYISSEGKDKEGLIFKFEPKN